MVITCSRIAERFGTTVQDILELNPEITTPSVIFVGQEIRLVPSEDSADATEAPAEEATATEPCSNGDCRSHS